MYNEVVALSANSIPLLVTAQYYLRRKFRVFLFFCSHLKFQLFCGCHFWISYTRDIEFARGFVTAVLGSLDSRFQFTLWSKSRSCNLLWFKPRHLSRRYTLIWGGLHNGDVPLCSNLIPVLVAALCY